MIGKDFFVYILTNPRKTVLYTGMTNNLKRRVFEHKNHLVSGFSSKYKTTNLIYYEQGDSAYGTIVREKQIKDYSRIKKVALINRMNPEWDDLYETL